MRELRLFVKHTHSYQKPIVLALFAWEPLMQKFCVWITVSCSGGKLSYEIRIIPGQDLKLDRGRESLLVRT